MKKILTPLFCMILAVILILPVSGNSSLHRIVDDANLLSNQEVSALEGFAEEFCQQYGMDVVIHTVDSLGGQSIGNYADDYYDHHGYGVGSDYSGCILVVSMAERELYISTCGDAIARLNDRELDDIIANIAGSLSNGDYYEAFELYFGFLALSIDYDLDNDGDAAKDETGINWLLSILIGAVVSSISVFFMAQAMNTKRPQHSAGDYLDQGSYDLRYRKDIFLYSNISKVKRQQNTSSSGGGSSHRSSSGRSHGGRGGRF